MEVIEEEGLVDNARDVGQKLLAGLQAVEQDYAGLVSNARGRGLMCAFDLPDEGTRDTFLKRAYDNGMLILGCGPSSVRFRPALTLTPEECEEGLELTRRSLEAI
jgi:L-lysine 6-transaminase